MKKHFADKLFGIVVLLPFAAAIVWLHWLRSVPFNAFVFGAGSWGVGCFVKLVLYHTIVRRLPHNRDGMVRVSLLNGAFSGLTELGGGILLFWIWIRFFGPMSLADLVGFGIGIGAIEAFLVATPGNPLKGTALEQNSVELENKLESIPGFRGIMYGYGLPFVERIIAAGIHVGTRGLAYITLRSGNLIPAGVALLIFVLADGLVGYRLLGEGKLTDLSILRRAYLILIGLMLLALAAFALFWRSGAYVLS